MLWFVRLGSEGEHVVPGDPASRAGALDETQVNALLFSKLSGYGRGSEIVFEHGCPLLLGFYGARRWRFCNGLVNCSLFGLVGRVGLFGLGLRSGRSGGHRILTRFSDDGNRLSDGYGGAFSDEHFQEHSRDRGLEVDGGLVGLDLRDRVAQGHLGTLLDQPPDDRALLHVVAHLGHVELSGHFCPRLLCSLLGCVDSMSSRAQRGI